MSKIKLAIITNKYIKNKIISSLCQHLAKLAKHKYKENMETTTLCPQCKSPVVRYRNPFPTTDVIIYDADNPERGIVLIERVNEPYGFAIPGGFVDMGERVEHAAVREMREETSLDVELMGLLGVYSDPSRDPRFHTMSIVYVGKAKNADALCAGDDAKHAAFYPLDALPPLAFDHAKVIEDYKLFLAQKRPLAPLDSSL